MLSIENLGFLLKKGHTMNAVDKVKTICKERGIPISRLERDCGFSNGYIRGLKEGNFPSDRLAVIADYLAIPISELLDVETDEHYYIDPETRATAEELRTNKDLRVLFDAARNATPEDLRTAHAVLLALKRKEQHVEE